jgi:XTP/dITP diphosphohydrolase
MQTTMRHRLLLATHNTHKVQEIRDILLEEKLPYEVVSLHELGDDEEIDETGTTLSENALIKAQTGFERHHVDCFADDTGLEVAALGGRPGVYTARYAGPACRPEDNIRKLLGELQGVSDRRAAFKTVIALILDGQEYTFTGQVDGVITEAPSGASGFGYDPIFRPDGYDRTFAEMSEEEKNKISHRGRATAALVDFLRRRTND